MAYGFLRREAEKNNWVKDYLDDGMIFEAFITVIRESDTSAEKIVDAVEKEIYLKNSRLTDDEAETLQVECNQVLGDAL